MIINIIIAVIFIIILGITIMFSDLNRAAYFLFILSIVGFLLYVHVIESNIPAIEVYRGNTTLQITYEGDIPIDSTVVWKNK